MLSTEHFLLPAAADIGLFDPSKLSRSNSIVRRKTAGRGEVVFFQHESCSLVLRHYHRGGWAAKLSKDKYCWWNIEATRAWREYRLLTYLQRRELPAPRVYAAHVERYGLLYRADLITHYIDNAQTLAEKLSSSALPMVVFEQIGVTIRRFHDAGIDHVDLNATNILLDQNGAIYLVDFDHCRHREDTHMHARWRQRNLQRLKRSLRKECAEHFADEAWAALCQGYQ